ncbi:unnamed protein product, partial [Polarella glacialis]
AGDEVRHYVASGGRNLPQQQAVDTEDSPCPYTGAGASWDAETPTPWWVEAQSHTEGPPDDESIPRKLEGWWRVAEYGRDAQSEVGEDLSQGELCFMEKLWSDRIRVFKAGPAGPAGVVPLSRVCDMQLMKKSGSAVGSRWDLLRDVGEGGDDPDEIRVGQKRTLLGGEYGNLKLKGLECDILNYVEWMDRWTVELPVKDPKGKNLVVAVVPSQLRSPKLPREPKPNGKVCLGLALRSRALELWFQDAGLPASVSGAGASASRGPGDGRFRLRLQFVSRVRPGGRIWTSSSESMYKYIEVRYIASGDYGLVFRVLRMVDPSKKALDEEEEEEDPYQVLDVPRGSDRAAITKAYRIGARRWHPDKVPEEYREQSLRSAMAIRIAVLQALALMCWAAFDPSFGEPSTTVGIALQDDDQCATAGDGSHQECSLSALQLERRPTSSLLGETSDQRKGNVGDLSLQEKNAFVLSAKSKQAEIMILWNNLSALEKPVNVSVTPLGDICGDKPEWDEDLGPPTHTERVRSLKRASAEPRAAFIEKQFTYLQKELDLEWKTLTKVGRMVEAIKAVLPRQQCLTEVRSQILQLNGYDHHRMTPAQSAETLTELLKISHDEFEYEAKMVDHTKEEFKKYAYQYGKGTDRTNTRTERDTLSADTLWTEKDTKALGDFDPNLGIRIKVENKDLDKVQGMVTVLMLWVASHEISTPSSPDKGHNETAPLSEEEEDPDDDLTVLEIKPKYRIIKKKSLMKELQSKESDLLNQVADLQAQMLTLKTEVSQVLPLASQWLDDCPNDGK